MDNTQSLQLHESLGVNKESPRGCSSQIQPAGYYKAELIRDGKVIETIEFPNIVTNEGKNKLLDVMFNGVTPITTWYIGLMDNSGYSSNPATDTMSSHAGWTEFTAYTEANRQSWGVGSASSQQITNASPATFTVNATGAVRGIFVTSSNTKTGTTGTLWSTALFSASLAVANTDVIKITYTVAA